MTKSTGQRKTKVTLSPKRKAIVKAISDNGASATKIAKAFGVSRTYIYKIKKEIESSPELFNWYEAKRSNVQLLTQVKDSQVQDLILGSITKKEIKEASLGQKARLFAALGTDRRGEYIQERLERDKSTDNKAILYKLVLDMQGEEEEELINVSNS